MHEEALDSHAVRCPYCDTGFELLVDLSQGSHTTWEDCPQCCSPIQMRIEVSLLSGELESLTLGRDDEVL
ncbi:CPXCG motif-containing cysteine-rich protein [Halomonas sp. B23F22_10]|uniref:CPXCG motif-containing cysteine-rich protein n=1 Tax=Halomonas sp. B23F22_10 TaxID=3459515 RepID=UPI00373EDA74